MAGTDHVPIIAHSWFYLDGNQKVKSERKYIKMDNLHPQEVTMPTGDPRNFGAMGPVVETGAPSDPHEDERAVRPHLGHVCTEEVRQISKGPARRAPTLFAARAPTPRITPRAPTRVRVNIGG